MKRFLPFALILLIGIQTGARPPADFSARERPEAAQAIDNDTYIDANDILMFVTNHGNFGRDLAGVFGNDAGTYYPYTTVDDIQLGIRDDYVLYAAGLWAGGVDAMTHDTLVVVSEYTSEYVPGPMAGGTYQPDDPWFRVYKLHSDSLASNPNIDYWYWPDDQGAPVDHLGEPVMLGDQMLWTVYNDADPSQHTNNNAQTDPLGVEIRQTAWAYDHDSGPPASTIFIKYTLHNRGSRVFYDFYLSLWFDPDLGGSIDDLIGCDTINQTMFCYNGDNDDTDYGATPPAFGVKVMYGPLVSAPGLTGYFDGNAVANHDNLPMTAFTKYINGTDPENYVETYAYMMGLRAKEPGFPPYEYDGQTLTFMHSGDPIAGTGDLDIYPDDKRMMVSFGPFDFAAGDSQFVQIAVVAAEGSDRFNSLANLNDLMSQLEPEPHTPVTLRVPADYPTIQDGINAAWPGDTVLVAPGTYTGDGNRDLDFGGKNVVLRSESGRDVTIIDCEGTTTDRHRGFYLSSGESADAVIEGFTFTNGYETIGAGGWCVNSASPTIRDCAFINNTAEGSVSNDTPGYWEEKEAGRGGAVNCNNTATEIRRCIFSGNEAIGGYQIVNSGDDPAALPGLGGAVRVGGSPIVIADCSFVGNAADEGGAVFFRRNNTSLTDNTFNSNSASLGGAVHCARANPTISRNNFTANTATSGGAIYCTLNSSPTIRRNTIIGGSATNGGAIYLARSNPTIIANDISGNTASESGGGISCYQGSAPEIADNTIGYNLSNVNGGGIFIGPSAPTISHNVIYGNVAGQLGGGISCSSSDATITNNTIVNDSAVSGGSCVALVGASLTLENCILASSDVSSPISCTDEAVPTLSHCDVYCVDAGNWIGCIADQANINGNFSADPMFCDAAGNDYHISILSPCAATNNSSGSLIGALEANCGYFTCGDVDLDGELTSADIEALIAAYYNTLPIYFPTPTGDMDCDDVITLADLVILAGYYYGYGPAPCCDPPPKRIDLPGPDQNGGPPRL